MSSPKELLCFNSPEEVLDFNAAKAANESLKKLLETKPSLVYLLLALSVLKQANMLDAVFLVWYFYNVVGFHKVNESPSPDYVKAKVFNNCFEINSGEIRFKQTDEDLRLSLMAFLRADLVGDSSDKYEADILISDIEVLGKSGRAYFREDLSDYLKFFETVLNLGDYNKESESTIFLNSVVDELAKLFRDGLASIKSEKLCDVVSYLYNMIS
jgi:hypothetical protein